MTVLSASVLLNRLQAKARLRHLLPLIKLALLRGLNRGAEALSLSQPAVTQLLADQKRLVELPLFELGIDGLFSDFADTALQARDAYLGELGR